MTSWLDDAEIDTFSVLLGLNIAMHIVFWMLIAVRVW